PGATPSGILGGGGPTPDGPGGPSGGTPSPDELFGDLEGNGEQQPGAEGNIEGESVPATPAPPVAEGLDLDAQRALSEELAEYQKSKKRKALLETWALRRGKDLESAEPDYSVGLEHLIGSKELDGLSK